MTTKSSIKVNPRREELGMADFLSGGTTTFGEFDASHFNECERSE
jgi:hypothetical protein